MKIVYAHEHVGLFMGSMGLPGACLGFGSSMCGFVHVGENLSGRGARRGSAVPGGEEAPVVCEPPVFG